jgi:hypothetical protein
VRRDRFIEAMLIGAVLGLLAIVLLANDADAGSKSLAVTTAQEPAACGGHHHGATHGLARFDRVLERAWEREDWTVDDPRSAGQVERLRHFKACARGDRVRRLMREHAAETRRGYRRWQARLEFRYTVTPYDCGSHGFFAIPCYIVDCESDFNWHAANGPHGGPYQINLGLHGAPWPIYGPAEKRAHHLIAARLWAGGSGASHWTCA